MKNGKRPTLSQKKEMRVHGLKPENWLVVKDTKFLEVVSGAAQGRNVQEDYIGSDSCEEGCKQAEAYGFWKKSED